MQKLFEPQDTVYMVSITDGISKYTVGDRDHEKYLLISSLDPSVEIVCYFEDYPELYSSFDMAKTALESRITDQIMMSLFKIAESKHKTQIIEEKLESQLKLMLGDNFELPQSAIELKNTSISLAGNVLTDIRQAVTKRISERNAAF